MSNQDHNQKLIATKQRPLQKLQEQEAMMGINTPPHISIEIEDIEEEIAQLQAQFQPSINTPPAAPASPPAAPPTTTPPAKPHIFISYSHKDEMWKDRLMTHLQVLALEDYFEVWDDRQITTGEDWYTEIEQAMTQASLAVLLVTANFLTSDFIRGKEVPHLMERRRSEGMRVYPIIVAPCPWQRVEWLSRIQVRPKDGKEQSWPASRQKDNVRNRRAGLPKGLR